MPIQIEESKTPKGQRVMLAHVSGTVTLQDAQGMGELLKPGRPYHRALVLSVVDGSTDYQPDARRHFPTFNGNYRRIAAVVTSPVVRAVVNFMIRMSAKTMEVRLFADEASALAWLDA